MTPNDDKRAAFEAAYDKGKVRVVFDMTVEGVEIPDAARKLSTDGRGLALDYSRTFHMPNFKVSDEGIGATLSFGNRPHWTFVPWAAVRVIKQNDVPLEMWPDNPNVKIKVLSGDDAKKFLEQIMGQALEPDESPYMMQPTDVLEEQGWDPSEMKWFATEVAEG